MQAPTAPKSLLGRHRLLAPTASVRVSPLCLGGMSLGTNWAWGMGSCTKEMAFELLDTFYDLGGNFIDTANVYQGGQSEEWIGEWMQKTGRRDEMVIATKYAMGYKAGHPVVQSNYGGTGSKSLHLAVEASLEKLQTSYIDLACTISFFFTPLTNAVFCSLLGLCDIHPRADAITQCPDTGTQDLISRHQ